MMLLRLPRAQGLALFGRWATLVQNGCGGHHLSTSSSFFSLSCAANTRCDACRHHLCPHSVSHTGRSIVIVTATATGTVVAARVIIIVVVPPRVAIATLPQRPIQGSEGGGGSGHRFWVVFALVAPGGGVARLTCWQAYAVAGPIDILTWTLFVCLLRQFANGGS